MTQLVDPRYDSIQIHLRSDDDDLTTDATRSSLTFTFQRIIQIPPQTKALISVLNAQIPNTFYTLTHRIRLTMFIDPTGIQQPPVINPTFIYLEIGKYTPCSFAKLINDQTFHWTAAYAPLPVAQTLYPDWECAIDDLNKKWRVDCTPPTSWAIGPVDYELIPNSGAWIQLPFVEQNDDSFNLCRMFGVVDRQFNVFINQFVGNYQLAITGSPAWGVTPNIYYSPQIPDFTGNHNLYIGTQLVTNSVDSLIGGLENTLAKIPVSAPYGSMIQYNGESRAGTLLEQQFLSEIHLEVQNHHNRVIDLNGVRWNITLLLQFINEEDGENADPHFMSAEQIRTKPLSSQNKLRAGNRNRKVAMKHRLKKYLDKLTKPKDISSEIYQHNIGKTPIVQSLAGIVSGSSPNGKKNEKETVIKAKSAVEGIDTQITHPLPS